MPQPSATGAPAVAADVEEGPQLAVVAPDHEHGHPAGDGGGQVAARLLDGVGAGHADPLPGEDPLHLQGVVGRVGVPVAGQGAGPLDRLAPTQPASSSSDGM